MNPYKIEWCLSLLSKYSVQILENDFKDIKLTKTQMLFIIHLKQRPGIHQDHLAEIFKMERSTVTRAVQRLIQLEFIKKEVDEKNRKANCLFLTTVGDDVYNQVMTKLLEWTGVLTKGMTKEEIDMSIRLLSKMASNACHHLGDDKLAELIGKGV